MSSIAMAYGPGMEIHQLRYVDLVAREESFTAAAERARVSQSALSTQIAKLERELGHRLFERGRHGASPTAAGGRIIHLARIALQAIDGVAEGARELSGLVFGEVRIGAVVGCEMPWLSAGIAEFGAAHPGVALSYREGASDALIEDLRAGRLDLALVGHAEPLPGDLRARTLVDGGLVVLVPTTHPRGRLGVTDLAEHALITLPVGTGVRSALDLGARSAGITLRPAFEVHSGAMVVDLVRRGAGVGVLAAGMAEPAPDSTRALPLRGGFRSMLSLAHRPDPSPAARGLLEVLVAGIRA